MPIIGIAGWDSVNELWRPVLVDATGRPIIDPSDIFEDPPTEDETAKGAQSAWCYDHWKDASAHHAKYTDVEAVAAMGVKGDANPLNHDKYTLEAHASNHENGGSDEISVAGLDGETVELASHRSNHHPQAMKPNVTRIVLPGWYYQGSTWQAVAADTIYYIPIYVGNATNYDRVYIYVGVASAGTADLRIFNWSNGLPSSLLESWGTVSTSTTGTKYIDIDSDLGPDTHYFLAYRCSATPSLTVPDPTLAIMPAVQAFNTVSVFYIRELVLKVAAAYADPAPAPTGSEYASYAAMCFREG